MHAQFPFDTCQIAYYPFNTNTLDASGNGNHGTIHGASLTTDRFGNNFSAFIFDGVDDFISITPNSDVSSIGDFTISAWAYCESWEDQSGIVPDFTDFQYVFDGHSHSATATSDFLRDGFSVMYKFKTGGDELFTNSTYDIETTVITTELSIDTSVLNKWHHLVFIRNGNETRHYVDGDLISTELNNLSALNMQHDWYIGTFSANNQNYLSFNYNFDGKIDDIRIYNCALDSLAIQQLFKEPNTSVDELSENSLINVYPNPTADYIQITGIENGDVYIYDSEGRFVKSLILDKSMKIDFSDLPHGNYLLSIKSDGERIVKKVIISH
ncbi:MAG: hypothetical protein A2281_16660 [Bacteroidetes bacterium RIFOXYA12_FULL_38_20]|nr:MAG: hypothetical protein A2281_16660 [Bacteroidetes bacterium RIFOXYA12_FULL_38_20]